MDLNQKWEDYEYVVFDTETSGAYPLESEIVEFAAIKWKNGQELDQFQVLIKPSQKMSDFIIGIHGITNEMVEDQPSMSMVIKDIHDFFKGSIPVAHHAPFDLGFLAREFEKAKLEVPPNPPLCTSLLSRKLIPESPNHKLQTLVSVLGITKGQAHRALDDSRACVSVLYECLRRLNPGATLKDVLAVQEKDLSWHQYLITTSGQELIQTLANSIEEKRPVDILYAGGSGTRRIIPKGIVRNPDGDYVMAFCQRDATMKRFYLGKIKDCQLVFV